MASSEAESEFRGYAVAYDSDEAQFPIYVMAGLAAVFLAAAVTTGGWIWFVFGVLALAVAYYNFPVLETGRPQIGANEYGVFIRGFGIIRWSAIDRIEMVPIAVRILTVHELQLALKVPLSRALVADWRRVPWHRMLMRLPWTMDHNNVVRVKVDPFDKPPDEIHRVLLRMWRYYRS
ncbi:MAG: hypothetical protein WC807_04220 [Hyphomicrobium sp.]|jgi:hypothetical protein